MYSVGTSISKLRHKLNNAAEMNAERLAAITARNAGGVRGASVPDDGAVNRYAIDDVEFYGIAREEAVQSHRLEMTQKRNYCRLASGSRLISASKPAGADCRLAAASTC